MPDSTQAADFDAIIHFLQQDLVSADMAVAVNYIEQWENQLQGTEVFQALMELKQAVLDGNVTELKNTLQKAGEDTAAAANRIRQDGSRDIAAQVEQISQLLAQASQQVK